MYPEYPDWERLDFTYSQFGLPEVDNETLQVPVRDLWIYKGFPGYESEQKCTSATLLFEDVVSSERTLSEYGKLEVKDRYRHFNIERRYTILDGPFKLGQTKKHLHSILEVFHTTHMVGLNGTLKQHLFGLKLWSQSRVSSDSNRK